MRGLYSSPEGTRCVASADGALEYVEAALWDDQIDSIVLEISLACEGTLTHARTLALPATEFPDYAGIHGAMRTTMFPVQPPLAVRAGQEIQLMFRAGDPDASYAAYAVSGIHMQDVDPDCRFVSVDYSGIGPGTGDQWDYMARAYIH